jgi:hypothetical protein
MAGVLCKPPFTEVVEKNRIRCQRSLQDFYQRREQDCSRLAAFKNATVRERPILLKNSKMHPSQFLANLDRRRKLFPPIAAGSVRTILVARSAMSRLPPRPQLDEGPEGLQSFEHLRKRSFSTE